MVLTSWKPQWSYLKAGVTSCEKSPLALCLGIKYKGNWVFEEKKKEELLTFNILLSAEWNLPFVRCDSTSFLLLVPVPLTSKHFSFLPYYFLCCFLHHFFLLLFYFPFIYLLISLTPPIPRHTLLYYISSSLCVVSLLSFLLLFLFRLSIYSFSTLISPYLNYSIYLQLFSFILSLIPVFFFLLPSSIYSSSPLFSFSFSISPSSCSLLTIRW